MSNDFDDVPEFCSHGIQIDDCLVHADSLTDPLDDGSMPSPPFTFDPLCELKGLPWPSNAIEAAGFEYEICH